MTEAPTQHPKEADELITFVVTVHDRQSIGYIVLKLEALGLDVERVVKRTGVLGGRGPSWLLSKIRELPGVKTARAEHGFQLPPMHDSIPE